MNKSGTLLVGIFTSVLYLVSCTKSVYEIRDPQIIIKPDTRNVGYLSGDFHQHTAFTDGAWSFAHLMNKNNQFQLNWWANSEHGGLYNRNGSISGTDIGISITWDYLPDPLRKGNPPAGFLWRWQCLKDFSFPEVLKYRNLFIGKTIIQGFEWNVPGHEHADMAIITHQFDSLSWANDIAEFEYRFDNNDLDTTGGKELGWIKSKLSGHEKTLEAIHWVQALHCGYAYIVIGHPERLGRYKISDFRDMNNAGPDVCFGFEGMPGHHKHANRGIYLESFGTYGNCTYGGAGWMAAKTGGLWDALLSEGRHWWIFANSDFHDVANDFYPGEYQKNYIYVTDKTSPTAIIEGMHSGNCYFVTGDLIDSLYFSVNNTTMGGTCDISSDSVTISIKVHDPDTLNNNIYSSYKNPVLDHIDLIQGAVGEKKVPGTPEYQADFVTTTRVIARFDSIGGLVDNKNVVSTKWIPLVNGWKEMKFVVKNLTSNAYFRLRGTNHGLNVAGETDADGNPLPDDLMYPNNPQKAFADLWFYSNPIFVKIKN